MSGLAPTGAHPGPTPGLRPASYNTDHGDGAAASVPAAVCRCCHHSAAPARFVDTTRSLRSLPGAQPQVGPRCWLLPLPARRTGFLLCTLPATWLALGLVTGAASLCLLLGPRESALKPNTRNVSSREGCPSLCNSTLQAFSPGGEPPIEMLSAEKGTGAASSEASAIVR